MTRFRLAARVSSANLAGVLALLRERIGSHGTAELRGEEIVLQAELDGPSARDLNRALLTELRRVEKRTRLRTEWSSEGLTERFFDYVPKGPAPASDATR